MSIDRYSGESGEFDVDSESRSVYQVCYINKTCDGPSITYQGGVCRHQHRVYPGRQLCSIVKR